LFFFGFFFCNISVLKTKQSAGESRAAAESSLSQPVSCCLVSSKGALCLKMVVFWRAVNFRDPAPLLFDF
jgi:hypothetical protein